ncbi:PREDICTED: uncharacterized protein LOC104590086 [Nelumbo nucifera]|uniref:Uncharacterized protein n=2 Tax=Nelumbo nucifera TaxID=4432 RepID=A0A822XWB5_NELNU|nr:PREDICTED: uncharacterized protein LOC104590086 [Nelumbo nucifera]DAD24292.1 TPA_asm: hypothetical protein HUJ06_025756 [Nelumbo nucifera]
MDSSAVSTGQGEIFQTEGDNNASPTGKRPSSRRNRSLSYSSSFRSSSSSSSSLSSPNYPVDSPSSPLSSHHFSGTGIPFSWEKHPGIPKNSTVPRTSLSKYKDQSLVLLPLPPATSPTPSKRFNFEGLFWTRKKGSNGSLRKDPFIAALMECSKDQRDQEGVDDYSKNSKVSRTLSDRFGFIDLHASCKRSCAVTEAKVLIPRSSQASFDLVNRRYRSG